MAFKDCVLENEKKGPATLTHNILKQASLCSLMKEFNFKNIEKKWQDRWEKDKIFEVREEKRKEKFYILEMFPYPSGEGLHMGHTWNYVIGDILARYKIMKGLNVLHPMGYDSLGLPAENAAIKSGTHPEDYTKNSIKNFIKQQKALGLSFDWSRVLSTADPEYYKWDQWIFLKMLGKNLAYQKESAVNWCPKCETVLANEQVHDGKCWRHEKTNVRVKNLKQWFLKITNYANELYEGIDNLDWPEKTKAMQKNWIGKSEGTEILFEINKEKWPIFTTRPDTIFGVTFMVISAQHQKLKNLITPKQKKAVENFQNKLNSVSERDLSDLEKEGVFTGSYAVNPISSEKVPIYAGNFVVADYGSGMVMAVPAHDQRDFEFAKKYKIEIKPVIDGGNDKGAFEGNGRLFNSGKFNNLNSEKAKEEITKFLIQKKLGKKVTNFKLRDWGISRQRYWGTPIPVIHCGKCETVPVPEKDLPIILPKNVKFGKGNPLETATNWINVKCPKCKGNAKRETDTMDTFVNSSWYFLRFTDKNNNKEIFKKSKANYWCPIDAYIGGAEHACMHLIYSRFYTKFLRDLDLIDFDEPAAGLFHQGLIYGEDGFKMSKSRGNVIEPLNILKKYGADTLRFFLVSAASPDKDFDWSEKEIGGSLKFIKRVISFYENNKIGKDSELLANKINSSVKKIEEFYETFEYRKATIEIRELFEILEKQKEASKETLEKFLQLLSPICPHITEELWEKLGNTKLITKSNWPKSKEIKSNKQTKDINDSIINHIKEVISKVSSPFNKIFIYIMPFELSKINTKKIKESFKQELEIFAVNDQKKYDPEKKSKKAIPGRPGVYLKQ